VIDREAAAEAVAQLLRALGRSPESEPELHKTPQLVANAYADELLAGYGMDPKEILSESLATTSTEVIALREIDATLICPHHLMPATGRVHVAYAPSGRIVGLGALARLVHCYSRRLTLQESFVQNVADALCAHLGARGAACVAVLSPTCLTARGERCQSATAVSLGTAGEMREGRSLHAACLALFGETTR
jgi:GTP cyclohydrolase I